MALVFGTCSVSLILYEICFRQNNHRSYEHVDMFKNTIEVKILIKKNKSISALCCLPFDHMIFFPLIFLLIIS